MTDANETPDETRTDPGDHPLFADRAPSGEPYLFPGRGRPRRPAAGLAPAPRITRQARPAREQHVKPTKDGQARSARDEIRPAGEAPGGARPPRARPRPGPLPSLPPATATPPKLPDRPPRRRRLPWSQLVAKLRAPTGDGACVGVIIGPVETTTVRRRLLRIPRSTATVASIVHRFQVRPTSGPDQWYALEGEKPPHDALGSGTIVRVTGRRTRDGHLLAREVEVLATLDGPVVRVVAPRPRRAYRAVYWLVRLGLGLVMSLGLVAVLLLITGLFD